QRLRVVGIVARAEDEPPVLIVEDCADWTVYVDARAESLRMPGAIGGGHGPSFTSMATTLDGCSATGFRRSDAVDSPPRPCDRVREGTRASRSRRIAAKCNAAARR